MLVESLTVRQALSSFLERVEADEQIRNQINEEHLPCGKVAAFLDDDRRDKQNHRNGYFYDLVFLARFMMMFMLVFATFVFVMMCHNAIIL